METRRIPVEDSFPDGYQEAGKILREGGLVAVPTETVYGLAANAFDAEAVARIFEAKGRPQDNPLIVHIADLSQLQEIVQEIPEGAQEIMDRFWPGPLTLVMKRGERIPPVVSAGLDTVAVRFPSHPVTQKIIMAAGVPLAAPSANLSGRPSPTCAAHVLEDLDGRIEAVAVVDGYCAVGVESTVLDVTEHPFTLLRPGGITPEQIKEICGEIRISSGVLDQLPEGAKAASPGMKYKHYAPKGHILLLKGSQEAFLEFVRTKAEPDAVVLCSEGEETQIPFRCICYGRAGDAASQAKGLFDALRRLDEIGAKVIYARCPDPEGIGLALYNRLVRAAGFEVLDLEK